MFLKSLSVFAFAATLSASLCGSASAAALLTSHVPQAVAQHKVALAGHVDLRRPLEKNLELAQ